MSILCKLTDLTLGQALGVDLNGSRYLVLQDENGVYVYHNRCPHLGVPLEWQEQQFMDPDGELIRCATHGALFLPDTGECVYGPCIGQYLNAETFVLSGGLVLIDN